MSRSDVVVNVRSNAAEAEAVASAARARGVRALTFLADVSQPEQIADMMRFAQGEWGGVDILVNNVATRPRQAFLEISPEDWDRVLATNLSSAFHACRAVLPMMVERGFGRILNISGTDAFVGTALRAHNVTSKAGIIGLTKALAAEFGRHGVTVNAVVPGLLNTTRDEADYDPGVINTWCDGLPISRTGTTEEVASLCAFLASSDGAYITGQSLHVNGGGWM